MTSTNHRFTSPPSHAATVAWRSPLLIIGFGCLISLMCNGPRSSLGFFLTPMSADNQWGRDVFAFALAIQNLLWGIGSRSPASSPTGSAPIRVFCAGALMFALGLALMSHASSAPVLDLSAGEPPNCAFRLGLQTGSSVSTASKVQFAAGFFVDAKRMAISKSSSVRSTTRMRRIDRQADVRKLRDKLFQPRKQNLVGKCRRAADRERPGRLAAGQLVARLGENAQRLIDQGRINVAGAGQPQPARFAIEKLDAEPVLEGLDAVTDGACRQVQLLGGFAEAVVAGGSLEDPQRTQWGKPERHACRSLQCVSFGHYKASDIIKCLGQPAKCAAAARLGAGPSSKPPTLIAMAGTATSSPP